ncbi:hypothetical protein Tsubulata_037890 [Turnera subulata]|uniref:DUF4283 domain-containing protein n=1 Tax=Turnera subulata TaxID=218843 RepID=A0A9Q0JCH8_9ROSI|nr:hypothetical protein Tsubulata_037890 [Turnera subulata]
MLNLLRSSSRLSFLETLLRDQECAKERQPAVDLVEANRRDSLILPVLRRDIGYKALHTRLVHIWQPMGQLDLLDLAARCFLARLSQPEDIERVIKQGPWTVQGHYLTKRRMSVVQATLPLEHGPGNAVAASRVTSGNCYAVVATQEENVGSSPPCAPMMSDVMKIVPPHSKQEPELPDGAVAGHPPGQELAYTEPSLQETDWSVVLWMLFF